MSFIKRLSLSIFLLILPFYAAVITAPTPVIAATCGGVQTSFDFKCAQNADPKSGDINRSPVFGILLFILNLLAVGVGVAAVGFIVWGAIVYITAGGSADQVKQGINYIRNTLIGLLLYMLMYAAANYLIPGGVFTQQ